MPYSNCKQQAAACGLTIFIEIVEVRNVRINNMLQKSTTNLHIRILTILSRRVLVGVNGAAGGMS